MCEMPSCTIRGKMIELSEAVGTVLAHDITEVTKKVKGPAFKKGHVVQESDLDYLARLGKRHLYVLDIPEGMMHEDDAALVLAEALAGPGVTYDPNPSEGKISLVAAHDGLLKIHVDALTDFNTVEGVMCASRHDNTIVKKGQLLAGTRAIPLVIEEEIVITAEAAAKQAMGGVFSVRQLSRLKTGLIITGSEVFTGIIKDKFAPTIVPKLEHYECPVLRVDYAPDDSDFIADAITKMIEDGAEMLILTGGMSVDPDDVTRVGVTKAGAFEILYGSAVLPGAMLLLAEIRGVPIIGVPACGLFHERTIFDLVLPRVLAGEKLTRRDLAAMGHGGLCLNCDVCRYPICPFGK